MGKFVIAVDLGGTNLRVGLVSEEGRVEFSEKLLSESKLKSTELLERMAAAIQKITDRVSEQKRTVTGLALGIPGIVEVKKGIVYQSPHFPDWKRVEAASFFRQKFSWPVVIDNDAHMVARGEGWMGAGRGHPNFILMTLGTGIGGAIIWKGEILSGDSGFGGEVGHIVIQSEGRPCNCGSRGCLEMYASATGIVYGIDHADERDVKGKAELLERVGGVGKLTVSKIYEAAKDGDFYAHSIFQRVGYYLGIGIASLVNATGIETVILGGGVSQAWDFFIEPTKKEIAERTYEETARRVQIKKAELGDDAGLLGGAAAIFKM